jgi:glyoxylase-like metal-dependent hydrolase (beta-lactamase superfamily II)
MHLPPFVFFLFLSQQPNAAPPPLVQENGTVKVSDRVYVIPDRSVPAVPNVGIIVGDRATLVIDTGLGPRNGQTILREVEKISKNAEMYVVSTHFHPEHALGEPAFPATAKIIRAAAQQKDIAEFGLATANNFASRTPVMAELLKGVRFREANEIFETEKILDLGGVRARIVWVGPTHTRGDTVIFIEGDNVLFAGDVVMNRRFVSFASPYSSIDTWLKSLDRLEPLHPAKIVPSHGDMGDASLITQNREYLKGLRTRVAELKKQGKSSEETAQILSGELQAKYPGWTGPNAIVAAARIAYTEAH